MAKAKTKQMPMDTTCEQQENGSWQWKTEGFTWAWTEGFGVNTGIVTKNDKFVGKIFAKTLNDAVMYSRGFVQGFKNDKFVGKIFAKTLNDAVMYSRGFVQGFNEGTKMGN